MQCLVGHMRAARTRRATLEMHVDRLGKGIHAACGGDGSGGMVAAVAASGAYIQVKYTSCQSKSGKAARRSRLKHAAPPEITTARNAQTNTSTRSVFAQSWRAPVHLAINKFHDSCTYNTVSDVNQLLMVAVLVA